MVKLSTLKTSSDAPMQETLPEAAPQMAEKADAERALTAFDSVSSDGANAALLAVVDETKSATRAPFPIIAVAGGVDSGAGQYGPLEGTPDDVAQKLPAGRGVIQGVFVGYRTEIIAWDTGYNDRNKSKDADGQPGWGGVLDPRNEADAKLVTAATEAYQFTKAAERAKFDGIGHVKPSLQLLMFLPKLGGLAVVQAPAHFNTWAMTSANLKRLIDPTSKRLGQFPATVKPLALEKNGRKDVTIEIAQLLTEESKAWWDAYVAYRATVALDPEALATVRGWLGALDNPITDEVREKLKACAALKTPRG